MFALNLLGGAVLESGDGPVTGRAAHKRRLALLAILAAARGRTVARERVIGLLWPDQPSESARHSLSESLYVLRKELGEGALLNAGDEVGLDVDAVRSDVAEFQRQVEEGSLQEAVALYRGPFLDGFYVADAPEFERWAESERGRLAHAFARAVECLAEAAEREQRFADAAEWWRRLAVQDPFDSRVGTRLMRALEAAGQRAAALWFARTHTTLLREELGVEPDDEFTALVERLASEPVPIPSSPSIAAPSGTSDVNEAISLDAFADIVPPRATPAAFLPGPERGDGGAPAAEREPAGRVDSADAERAADPHPVVPTAGMMADGEKAADGPGAGAGADPPAHGVQGTATGHAGGETRADDTIVVLGTAPAGTPVAITVTAAPPESGRGRGARRWAYPAGIAGLAAGLLLSLAASPSPPPRESGYDPRRIAVLYFDDNSAGGELGYVANGLTEMLIHALSQVQALEVISRNGVKPYRDNPVRFDSMVADLRVGSVVEGSVQRSGDSVRVTVQLIDANTNAHLESRTVVAPITGVFELEDALSAEVSGFLRRRLGREIQLRQTRAETRSAEAWRLVWQAEQAFDDAARMGGTGEPLDAASAGRLLLQADSTLARAEDEDPRWSRPLVLRGWVAYRRALLSGAPSAPLLADARRRAERVLAREPRSPMALELRGTLLLQEAAGSAQGAGQAARLDSAERDLRAAVSAEPSLATAWRTLSLVLRYGGRIAESDVAAHRALAEDAYLDDADDILHRLYINALLLRDFAEARALCDRGHRAAPEDWKFLECGLALLREDPAAEPDAERAWRIAAELERVDPPARAVSENRAYSPVYRLALVAAVLARAGARDSARTVLARARRAAGGDAELHLSLSYDEAVVMLLLGDTEAARTLMDQVLARRPALRPFATRDPLLRGLFNAREPGARTPPAGGAPPFR